jgi:uncharacterized protein YifE (UPF0438 family)
MSPTTLYTNYDNEKLFNEITFPYNIVYIFWGIIGLYSLISALFSKCWPEEECEDEDEECEEEDEDEEDDSFVIFPDTLKVSDDGNTYIFEKYRYTIMENGSLHIITGDTLKKLESKERRQARKEEKQRAKEQRDEELLRIADETQLRETLSRLNAILENHPTVDTQVKRKRKVYFRPLDYGHRYLQDQDQLTSTLRGQTVDVLYRKGSTAKEDRYLAVFAGNTHATEFKSLNQVAAELARRVEINGPNAWSSFKRVKPNGELESIERLDIIE